MFNCVCMDMCVCVCVRMCMCFLFARKEKKRKDNTTTNNININYKMTISFFLPIIPQPNKPLESLQGSQPWRYLNCTNMSFRLLSIAHRVPLYKTIPHLSCSNVLCLGLQVVGLVGWGSGFISWSLHLFDR